MFALGVADNMDQSMVYLQTLLLLHTIYSIVITGAAIQ